MSLQADFFKKTFHFNFRARTSRGLMRDKVSWFVRVWDSKRPDIVGVGECGPLPGLSIDNPANIESEITNCIEKITALTSPDVSSVKNIVSAGYPAITFAIETAFLDLSNGGRRMIYKNDFIEQGKKIPINGLIWMGDMDFMMTQINEKLALGFKCIKLKVGGLDFDRECDILHYLRKRYYKDDIMIRLDANGAFKLDEVLFKINELSKFKVDSIEQPIKPGLPEMEELCRKSPIPIAFDEELIGVTQPEARESLLRHLKPKFVILKPTLHGGLQSCAAWIQLAESLGIGWWMTSALESNIGLNAICQFTSNYDIKIPQGLGTGGIYSDNFNAPLVVAEGSIQYTSAGTWDEIKGS